MRNREAIEHRENGLNLMMAHDPLSLTSIMIPFHCAVSFGASISKAERLIATHDIHHLSATGTHEIVGIVTGRAQMSARSGKQRRRKLRVEEVYVKDIYAVDPRVPIATFGSAAVTPRGRLAAVFNRIDDCRCLGTLLHAYISPTGGDDAG